MESFMKKSKSFIMCAIMITSFLNSSYDSNRIAQKLTEVAPKAFGSFKMFDKPLNEVGAIELNAVILEGLALVQKANKNSKKSQEYSTRIIDAHNDLINAIKLTYNLIFLPYENKGRLSGHESKMILNEKNKCVARFSEIQDNMAKLIKEVKDKKLFRSGIAEKDILVEIANYISSYADNALGSIEYKLSTENKVSADTTRPWVGRM